MGITSDFKKPDCSQIEVTLIGPGFGECVLIHLGNNAWIVVDSCINNVTGKPAALEYLEKLGVDPSKDVKLIVATHWHDDHVRGLSTLVTTCKDAEFCCSMAFTKKEFIQFLAAVNNNNSIIPGSGARELYNVLISKTEANEIIKRAVANKLLKRFDALTTEHECEIWSLSPSDEEINISLRGLAALYPQIPKPKNRIPSTSPNNSSVVLWIKIGETSIMLGGDMEDSSGNRGWSAIVNSTEKPQGQASVFKIPHHGSRNAHNDNVWHFMLANAPFAILSPFIRTPLPSKNDQNRICSLTQNAYATSNLRPRSSPKRIGMVEKTISETGIKIISSEPSTGLVQLRNKTANTNDWDVTLIGRACHLSEVYS